MMTGLGFMGLFGGLLMVLFLVALIGLPVWLMWTLANRGRNAPPPPFDFTQDRPVGNSASPREILDQRYARGEIDRDEYTQRKRDLG